MNPLELAAATMAAIALWRIRRKGALQRRIAELERQLSELRRRVSLAEPSISPEPEPARAQSVSPPGAGSAAAPPPVFETPPPAARPAEPPPSPPRPPAVRIDWERWLGVRGAAVLGGVVLALAGVYFFKYSIEHGLIPPWLRVVTGTLLGVGCIAAAEWKARARYQAAANGLIGGGIVVLYSAFWAARSLYGLVGSELALVAMISVTATCTALAYRHASLVIALIGLIGGFLTPLLLSTGQDRPIALFSYILLLDAGLLFIAQRRGWPLLALLSLVGTLVYQALWIGSRMQAGQLLLAIGVLAIFAVAYAYALRGLPTAGRRQWLVTQAGGALFPFVFALYLAGRSDLGEHFYPVALLLALLSGSAAWLARAQQRAWLGLGAACGSTAVFAVWLIGRHLDAALAWEAAALCFLLAGVFHVFAELDRRPSGRDGPAPAAMVTSLGLQALLIAAAARSADADLWPWLCGWLLLAGLSFRHGTFPRRGALQVAAAALLAAGLWQFAWWHRGEPGAPSFATHCAVLIAVAVVAQVSALRRREATGKRWSERAGATFAVLASVSLAASPSFYDTPLLPPLSAALLGFLAALSATRIPSGRWLFAAMLSTALVHSAWTFAQATPEAPEAAVALAGQAVSLLLFASFPFAALARFRTERWAWYAAALAAPAWFPSLKVLYEASFGAQTIGLLPVLLGALALGSAWQAKRRRDAADPLVKSNLAWFLAVAFGFATLAIPLQLEKEWITIGWALEGLAVTLLWRRLDHPGLKYLGLALFAGVTIRLVANEAVLGYYPRPSWRVFNWLFYTYLVPTAAMIWSVRVLNAHEISRARPWERRVYAGGRPVGAAGVGLAAIAVIFVWLNLAIADWFASGATLRVSFERMPARDLTTSLVWALYALALLAAGVRASSRGLRWVSLGLMMVAVAKVFLHDLGELDDLYRVGSLLGLAVSLITISLLYQRFVVREATPGDT